MVVNERAVEMVVRAIRSHTDSENVEEAEALARHIVYKLELDTEAHAVKGPKYRGYTKIVRLIGPWFEP